MTVAVAYDAKPEGRVAVEAALEWAGLHETSVVVLHVEETGRAGTAGVAATPAAVRAVETQIETIAASRLGQPAPTWSVVSSTAAGDVASILLQLAAKSGAELLVVGSRRRSEIGKFFLGRVAQRVLLDSPVPVLVVKTE